MPHKRSFIGTFSQRQREQDRKAIKAQLVAAWHCNSNSSFCEEDWMIFHLWLETPQGFKFVPVAHVTDNSEAAEYRRGVYSGTPAGSNSLLLKREQFYVQSQRNTLFAAWTVPIPLFDQYILPPAGLLIEGYGEIRTNVSKTYAPSGRTQVWETNSFDAFITFFHPASKYCGSGTDGKLHREIFLTAYPPNSSPSL